MSTDIYLATGNEHKREEFAQLFDALGLPLRLLSANVVGGMPDVLEDAETFAGNALHKASALFAHTPVPAWVIADDSGLCVDALEGAPGVHSARYAGLEADAQANNTKLLQELADVPSIERTARFVCAVAVIQNSGVTHIFEGQCAGRLLSAPQGYAGFGYDPLFVPDGHTQTFAELGADVKNQISHRARALQAFADWYHEHY